MGKKIIFILFPVAVLIGSLCFLNNFLDENIKTLLEQKDLYSINTEYGSVYKDRGVAFNEYVTEKEEIVLEGSSEFGAPVSQVASTYFPNKGLGTLVINGRSYSQNLHQILMLGGQKNSDKKHKVAMILSIQWFMGENGIDEVGYQANFSPVQFYNFLSNEKISDEHKKQYASRASELLKNSTQFAPEKLYAESYISTGFDHYAVNILFKPYFSARKYILNLKDKGTLYKKLKTLEDKTTVSDDGDYEVDWEKEYEDAENEAAAQATDNDYYIFDNYFDSYLKNSIESQKDINKNVNLMASKEFEDYNLYLDTCKELGIEPYIILMPTNGRWYDHTGLTKEKRDEFYDTVQKMAEDRGFEVLNLKDEEYTPYFMCDVMHLGTKGWLKVDEEIYKHFN